MSRTATLYLLTEDYAERLSVLYDTLQQALNAEQQSSARLGQGSGVEALTAEYEALKAAAEAEGIKVVLRAVNRTVWRGIKEKHPPRTEGDPETIKSDRLAGVNVETVEDDLVYASIAEPEFTSRGAYDEWADSLSEGDFQTILARAWGLATTSSFNPKAAPSSPTPRSAAN